MGMTAEDRRRLKGSGTDERLGVKPVEAGRLIGESRNTVYRLLAAGKLHAVKRGTSTIVLMDSYPRTHGEPASRDVRCRSRRRFPHVETRRPQTDGHLYVGAFMGQEHVYPRLRLAPTKSGACND